MSYAALAQVDPVPPPRRPVSWPMILGWTAVVGMTLAVFNGTVNLGGTKMRANKRTSRRRSTRKPAKRKRTSLRAARISFRASQKKARKAVALYGRGRYAEPGQIYRRSMKGARSKLMRARMSAGRRRSSLRFNATRRSSAARPKAPKFSEMAVWQAVAAVRESGRSSEIASVLPPGVAAKFKHLSPGLYKYGRGPKKGEVIVKFKNASLKGAMTSTRIGASKVGEYHWVVDNFDPKFPVVIRGMDDHGRTFFRIEEHVKPRVRETVSVRRRATAK